MVMQAVSEVDPRLILRQAAPTLDVGLIKRSALCHLGLSHCQANLQLYFSYADVLFVR